MIKFCDTCGKSFKVLKYVHLTRSKYKHGDGKHTNNLKFRRVHSNKSPTFFVCKYCYIGN